MRIKVTACGTLTLGKHRPPSHAAPYPQRWADRFSEVAVNYEALDTVVLIRDLPAHGLKEGDLGAVVELYPPDAPEVEFVTASGRTTALFALKSTDVRPISDSGLVAVRSLTRAA